MLMTEVCSAHPPARPAHRVGLFADLMRSTTQDLKPSLCPTQDLPPYATQGHLTPKPSHTPHPRSLDLASNSSKLRRRPGSTLPQDRPRLYPSPSLAALTSQATARSFADGRVARFLKTGQGKLQGMKKRS
ncbi:hypothetical protein Taro_002143 [Colocasia esculenta]|uniref:Uncharacterized protein n=1 Tax=Colocasia esculenta TaxID=4460 RepID=A0A843TFN6_COLES|nr:hypothetical protein [Colocasia esculenta]